MFINYSSLFVLYNVCIYSFCIRISTARDFPPVANAGPDVDITLPIHTAYLNANLSSDDEAIVRYEWEIVKGDSDNVTLEGADSAIVTAYGLEEGLYTLKLTVYDRLGQTDEDKVNINVRGHYHSYLINIHTAYLKVHLVYLC